MEGVKGATGFSANVTNVHKIDPQLADPAASGMVAKERPCDLGAFSRAGPSLSPLTAVDFVLPMLVS